MNLPADITRCLGRGCPEAETCERFRQAGHDEMAPKGAAERVPTADTLRSAPGGSCGWRIEASHA